MALCARDRKECRRNTLHLRIMKAQREKQALQILKLTEEMAQNKMVL